MAGDWIKIEHALPDKPEGMEMAQILGFDSDAVGGKLIRVWTWFDNHTEDGNANVTVRALLDRYTGVTSFVTAMHQVGWIEEKDGFLSVSHFDRHNGQTAKTRANTNRRVAKSRNCNGGSVTSVTPGALQKPLPEKRREEKKESLFLLPEGEREFSRKFPVPDSVAGMIKKLYNRREKTQWGQDDCNAAKNIQFIPESDLLADLAIISKARARGWTAHRQDPATLMKNWQMDVDRANSFLKSNPTKVGNF